MAETVAQTIEVCITTRWCSPCAKTTEQTNQTIGRRLTWPGQKLAGLCHENFASIDLEFSVFAGTGDGEGFAVAFD
jgi:hypothetical protein